MGLPSDAMLRNSRYNLTIPTESGSLLYNSATGAVLCLSGADAEDLAAHLSGVPTAVSTDKLNSDLLAQLLEGGFLVEERIDEVAAIRERFQGAVEGTPIVLTITTTMDCNLACYYCYEERSGDRLELAQVPEVVRLARGLLARSRKDSFHVDWYGGEPLMNLLFLESASQALQELCVELGVVYSASIISNGTCWPANIEEFVRKHKIRQAQISFDGLRSHHEKRRRYREEYAHSGNPSSFDQAVRVVDELVRHIRVDLRLNLDRANRGDAIPFIQFARDRGWFQGKHRVVFQPARLASYTGHSSFMRRVELSIEEYEEIRALVRKEASSNFPVEEAEVPNRFPYPRNSVCAALARDSVVLGADAKLYRCGLQVSEAEEAIGLAPSSPATQFPILNNSAWLQRSKESWWRSFDPTVLPTCSRCSFLPVCWGGCPKKHLDRDQHALLEQGAYWRRNLPRLVAEGVGMNCDPAFRFNEGDQFKDSQISEAD